MGNVNADIVGFRDVRAMEDLKYTQLDELQNIVPHYQYKSFLPLRSVNKRNLKPGWEWEGIGFLSKHKILTVMSQNISVPYDSPDKSQRAILHLQFLIEPEQLELDVVLVEFSFHKITQVFVYSH